MWGWNRMDSRFCISIVSNIYLKYQSQKHSRRKTCLMGCTLWFWYSILWSSWLDLTWAYIVCTFVLPVLYCAASLRWPTKYRQMCIILSCNLVRCIHVWAAAPRNFLNYRTWENVFTLHHDSSSDCPGLNPVGQSGHLRLKAIVWPFGKYADSLSWQELDEQIYTTPVLNKQLQLVAAYLILA